MTVGLHPHEPDGQRFRCRKQKREATAPQSPVSKAGLHGKYHGLRRTRDGSEVEGWYFVVREGDPAGEVALLAYADACETYAPELAADLRQHVRDEQLARGLYNAGWER